MTRQRIHFQYRSIQVKLVALPDDEDRAREVPHFVSQRLKLGEIVLRAGVIDQLQLESALGEQKKWGGRLGVVLIKLGYATEKVLVNALASQLNLPVATLDGKKIPRRVLELIPYEFADNNTCLPLFLKDEDGTETLYVGMDDPCNLDVLDDLSFRTGMRVKPVVVAASEICEGIDRFYRDLDKAPVQVSPATVQPEFVLGEPVSPPNTGPVEESPDGKVDFADAPPLFPYERAVVALNEDAAKKLEKTNEDSTRVLLHALTQILIEKGLVTREEFHQRVLGLRDDGATEHD